MNTYEALFIFSDGLQDDRIKELGAQVKAEIEKAGGTVLQTRDIGRRSFARTMQKTESGVYLAVIMKIAGDKIAALNARFKLNDDIFRFQIVSLEEQFVNKDPSTTAAPERPERYDRSDRGSRDRSSYG